MFVLTQKPNQAMLRRPLVEEEEEEGKEGEGRMNPHGLAVFKRLISFF